MSVRSVALFMLLVLIICITCTGCELHAAEGVGEASKLSTGVFGAGTMLILFSAMLSVCSTVPGWRPMWLTLLSIGVLVMFAGCAALPMPLQPQNEQYNSNYAEGGFIVLAAIDTAQTMHIRRGTSCDHEANPIAAALYGSKYPKPGRVLITNLALITVHTMVTSWLDDKVAEHAHDDHAGLWYVGRIGWHGLSLFAEGSAVINNRARGCAL